MTNLTKSMKLVILLHFTKYDKDLRWQNQGALEAYIHLYPPPNSFFALKNIHEASLFIPKFPMIMHGPAKSHVAPPITYFDTAKIKVL